MNTPTVSPRATNPFILILIILLGFLGGYFYYSQIASEPYEIPLPSQIDDAQFLKFKDLRFDSSLFASEFFTSLKLVGRFPVEPGVTGTQDLFTPSF